MMCKCLIGKWCWNAWWVIDTAMPDGNLTLWWGHMKEERSESVFFMLYPLFRLLHEVSKVFLSLSYSDRAFPREGSLSFPPQSPHQLSLPSLRFNFTQHWTTGHLSFVKEEIADMMTPSSFSSNSPNSQLGLEPWVDLGTFSIFLCFFDLRHHRTLGLSPFWPRQRDQRETKIM